MFIFYSSHSLPVPPGVRKLPSVAGGIVPKGVEGLITRRWLQTSTAGCTSKHPVLSDCIAGVR
jgi:hypothetical protein